MSLQEPGPGESFATNVTFVTEVVCEDVHGERRHGDVAFAADVALLRVAGVEGAVGLLVSGKV